MRLKKAFKNLIPAFRDECQQREGKDREIHVPQ